MTTGGEHLNLTGGEELIRCQESLGIALSVHRHTGDTGRAGINNQSVQKTHPLPSRTTSKSRPSTTNRLSGIEKGQFQHRHTVHPEARAGRPKHEKENEFFQKKPHQAAAESAGCVLTILP